MMVLMSFIYDYKNDLNVSQQAQNKTMTTSYCKKSSSKDVLSIEKMNLLTSNSKMKVNTSDVDMCKIF